MEWVYRTSDGLWLRDRGGEALAAGEDVVSLPENALAPDVITERYDSLAPSKRRPATAAEMTAARDEIRDREIDGLSALAALTRATFELKTNAWTFQQFRDRIKAIYRSLG